MLVKYMEWTLSEWRKDWKRDDFGDEKGEYEIESETNKAIEINEQGGLDKI